MESVSCSEKDTNLGGGSGWTTYIGQEKELDGPQQTWHVEWENKKRLVSRSVEHCGNNPKYFSTNEYAQWKLNLIIFWAPVMSNAIVAGDTLLVVSPLFFGGTFIGSCLSPISAFGALSII